MLSVKEFSKFLITSRPIKTYCSRILLLDLSNSFGRRTTFHVPKNFYSDICKDDSKNKECVKSEREDSCIQTHPCSGKSSTSQDCCPETPQIKLRGCKHADVNPCKPKPDGYPSKIPSIQDCLPPNLKTPNPQPKCSWDKQDNTNKKKKSRILLMGLLVTALTLGAVSRTRQT